jgi:hypothetical protein
MEHIAHKIEADYPQFNFVHAKTACWSPRDNEVHYTLGKTYSMAGLFHELGHALLGHQHYQTDLDLLNKEIAAWEHAVILAPHYGTTINLNHIQDCLDTYRDWLHKRSTCPTCRANGLQTGPQIYSCLNCGHAWQVSSSRFCRPYRRSTSMKKDRNNVPTLSRFS